MLQSDKIILIKKLLIYIPYNYLSRSYISIRKIVLYTNIIAYFGTFDVLRNLFKVSIQFS